MVKIILVTGILSLALVGTQGYANTDYEEVPMDGEELSESLPIESQENVPLPEDTPEDTIDMEDLSQTEEELEMLDEEIPEAPDDLQLEE